MADVSTWMIREALREHFPQGAFAMLEEVRNTTGYANNLQSADAIVCSCWPSRGLWLAGIEIKVSRGDWQKELKHPKKSAEIQRWCDYWWVAAPAGLVLTAELPVTWGLIEYDPASRRKDKLAIRVAAPKLDPEPFSLTFVASILRNAGAAQAYLVAHAVSTAQQKMREECGADKVQELQHRLDAAERKASFAQADREKAQLAGEELARLKSLLGLHSWRDLDEELAARALRAGRLVREMGCQVMASRLRAAAAALEDVEKGTEGEL